MREDTNFKGSDVLSCPSVWSLFCGQGPVCSSRISSNMFRPSGKAPQIPRATNSSAIPRMVQTESGATTHQDALPQELEVYFHAQHSLYCAIYWFSACLTPFVCSIWVDSRSLCVSFGLRCLLPQQALLCLVWQTFVATFAFKDREWRLILYLGHLSQLMSGVSLWFVIHTVGLSICVRYVVSYC